MPKSPVLSRVTETQKQRLVWCMARYGIAFDSFLPAGCACDDKIMVGTHIDRDEFAALESAAQSMGLRTSPLIRGLLRSFLAEVRVAAQAYPPGYDRWGWLGPNRIGPGHDGQ